MRRRWLALPVLVSLLVVACGDGASTAERPAEGPVEPVVYEPLHPEATPLTAVEFEDALRAIVFDLDTRLLELRSALDGAPTIAILQSRLAQILPSIPSLFQGALEEVAALAPPEGWARDHARFVAEHRQLLRLRINLFGALNANRDGRAAQLATEIEERFAILQAELDAEFVVLTSAFFDGRRYGGSPP